MIVAEGRGAQKMTRTEVQTGNQEMETNQISTHHVIIQGSRHVTIHTHHVTINTHHVTINAHRVITIDTCHENTLSILGTIVINIASVTGDLLH